MARSTVSLRAASLTIVAVLALPLAALCVSSASAQSRPRTTRGVADTGAGRTRLDGAPGAEDASFRAMYQTFHATYKLGPDDQIAIFVAGEPDYTVETIKVSPAGRIFHKLIGEVEVVGLTVPQVTEKLAAEFREYIRDPRVTVSLLEAQSAKVGVLGEVNDPGIILLTRPMKVLDVITESGGFTDLGSKSRVTILRQSLGGAYQPMDVNVKNILEGKASAADNNVAIQSGDVIIVHGNKFKTWAKITSLTGFTGFSSFIGLGRGGAGR
jgi:polysaccharide export outer membrane protein